MDWSHWQVQGGADVGQQSQGLNFSDPGLLLDAASQELGIALVSQLLAGRARDQGQLVPLAEQTVRGPNWAWLVHRDSEGDPLTRSFCDWLVAALEED
ncbi:LysR substrate binding domain protein [compost metagenome]